MKLYICLIATCFSVSCISNKKTGTSTLKKEEANSKIIGKISHQYRATGCSIVILVNESALDAPLVLIPKDKLPDGLDDDGLEISFNYRVLRMPNPPGCDIGIPAEIKDIAKR